MKRNNSKIIIEHMQGLLVDMEQAAKQGLQYGEIGSFPSQLKRNTDNILAKVNLFWPFWRKQAEERGVDPVTLVRLEYEMSLAKILLKEIGR